MHNPYSDLSSDPAERAKSLFVHYFQISNNGQLNSDNVAEIASAVDAVIDAVIEQLPDSRIKRLEAQLASLSRSHKEALGKLEKANLALIGSLSELPPESVEVIDQLTEEISDFLS